MHVWLETNDIEEIKRTDWNNSLLIDLTGLLTAHISNGDSVRLEMKTRSLLLVLNAHTRADLGGGGSMGSGPPFFNWTPSLSLHLYKNSPNTFSINKVSCRRAVKNITKTW